MPGGDRTGPMGMGPMTGRAAGYCAGYDAPGYVDPMPWGGFGRGWGRGFGRGFGRGYRWQHWRYGPVFPAWTRFGFGPLPVTQEQEIASLKAQAEWLNQQLDAVNQCLSELESDE